MNIRYFALVIVLLGVAYYAFHSFAYDCDGGRIVNVNLVHDDPNVEPIRLDIPCEYFSQANNAIEDHDGNYSLIKIQFLKDSLAPNWPSRVDNPDQADDGIRLTLKRAFDASNISSSRSVFLDSRLAVSAEDLIAEHQGFEVYISPHVNYPVGSYTLYPKNQSPLKSYIQCVHSKGCRMLQGHTFYKGVFVTYSFKKEWLMDWEIIEANSKLLIDEFIQN
ncbi:MAG: hypothetical protein CMM94_08125 [Rickettsiales bacterium]|nr:hypothetical protein [Rickettsiales bacterium]